ncbi:hypothetical protein SHL15_7741 [Streptomyces hygroscopicus subsp. limoneus]|nr:hypothetical protein SHL15_7741 [Streptomyces hygroscopicus subsp. limoneus]
MPLLQLRGPVGGQEAFVAAARHLPVLAVIEAPAAQPLGVSAELGVEGPAPRTHRPLVGRVVVGAHPLRLVKPPRPVPRIRSPPGVDARVVIGEERALGQQRQPLPLLRHLYRQTTTGLLPPTATPVVAALSGHGEPAPPHRDLQLGREPDPLLRQPERRRARRALAVVEGHRLVRPGHSQAVEEHRPAGVELRTELHPDYLVRHVPLPADGLWAVDGPHPPPSRTSTDAHRHRFGPSVSPCRGTALGYRCPGRSVRPGGTPSYRQFRRNRSGSCPPGTLRSSFRSTSPPALASCSAAEDGICPPGVPGRAGHRGTRRPPL